MNVLVFWDQNGDWYYQYPELTFSGLIVRWKVWRGAYVVATGEWMLDQIDGYSTFQLEGVSLLDNVEVTIESPEGWEVTVNTQYVHLGLGGLYQSIAFGVAPAIKTFLPMLSR